MENKHFSLSTSENSRFIRIVRILFGLICIAVAFAWIIISIRSLKSEFTVWVTIIFLAGFGFYQLWSGLGRTAIFIRICDDRIVLKKYPILQPVEMISGDIERIELYPLKIIFFLGSRKSILLRFGTTYYETNEKIRDELIEFASSHNIRVEIIEEVL